METCVICRNKFESESPAILFVSGYGSKRCICEECEALLDKATATEETAEKAEAKEALTDRAAAMKDPEAVRVLMEVLSGETKEDAVTEEEKAEMEAVWQEIEKEEPEKEEKTPLWASIVPAAIILAFILFLVWFYFFR